jgi:tetratricopeptide (TPR) repeat protein
LAGAVLLGCTDSEPPASELAASGEASLASILAELQRDPDNIGIRLTYAERLASLGQFDSALAHCEQVLTAVAASPQALGLRGAILLHQGAHDAALADFDSALAGDSTLASAWSNRGQIWHYRGEFAAALADYERALQLEPARTPAHFNRALALERLGQREAAAAAFRAFLRQSSPLERLGSRRYAEDRLRQLGGDDRPRPSTEGRTP